MLKRSLLYISCLAAASIFLAFSFAQNSDKTQSPHAKTIALTQSANGIQPILTGPPETATMKSGYVILDPGHSVGRHSTEHHEEELVILEGQGEMLFHDGSKLEVKAPMALYCPPETEHDVKNTGTGRLRYVYIVASVPQ
jgi:mannose-6-phosphate isomerase-like protein (cupin superfamily)